MERVKAAYFESLTSALNQIVEKLGADGLEPDPENLSRYDFRPLTGPLERALTEHAPEFLQGVRCPGIFWNPDANNVLRSAVIETFRRAKWSSNRGRLEAEAKTVADDIGAFLMEPSFEVEVVARVHGLNLTEGANYEFEGQASLELTELDERARCLLGIENEPWLLGDAAVRAKFLVPKRQGELSEEFSENVMDIVISDVLRLVLAIQLTLNSDLGCSDIHTAPTAFIPAPFGRFNMRLERVRASHVGLNVDEAETARGIFQSLGGEVHRSLDLATKRFGMSCARSRSEDQVLDASIGLESILLFGKDQGELRYRFAMNYASLFDGAEERRGAFRQAQAIYDVRSALAHGGHPKDRILKAISAEGGLRAAARFGRRMLRTCILRFLEHASDPEFSKEGYWTERILGGFEDSRSGRSEHEGSPE